MSSELTMSPRTALELYCARTRIEIMFATLKQLIGAFRFRFWSKNLPRHSRRPIANRLLKAPLPQHLPRVQACWHAYDSFVLCGAIAQGLLKLLGYWYVNGYLQDLGTICLTGSISISW
jgi:hypothetical protein